MTVAAKQIRLQSIEVQGENTFVYHYEVGSYLKRFLADEPLWIRYEGSVLEIPPEIAAIPFLGFTFPWVRFLGGTIDLPVLDSTYADSMESLDEVFQSFYPQFKFAGKVNAAKKVLSAQRPGLRSAQLFTGGIDSFATALTHRAENPLLITVWGSEERVNQKNLWSRVFSERTDIAKRLGLQLTVIASNCYDILQSWAIETYFPIKLQRPWNLEIAFGSIFLGLVAPLAWKENIGTLYYASTFTSNNHPLDGTHPALIKKVSWAGTRVVLDGLEEERQDKIERISQTLDLEFPGLKFLVCTTPQETGNCSVCERCSCTMAGLALAGIDPAEHGFVVLTDTPEKIHRALEHGDWQMAFLDFWHQIQIRVPKYKETATPTWREFFDWFLDADLDKCNRKRSTLRRKEWRQTIKRILPFGFLCWLRKWKLRLQSSH